MGRRLLLLELGGTSYVESSILCCRFFQSCVFYSHISITDDDFRIFRQTTVSYFLIDLVWVALVPNCVKSPDVIIKVSCFGVVLEFDVSAIDELHLTKLTKLLSDISA